MSRRGNRLDDAPTEGFLASLGKEHVHHVRFRSRAEARAGVFGYVEVSHDRRRPHSALGYRRQAADVGRPDRVGPVGRDVAVEQVGRDRVVVPAAGGPRRPASSPAGGEAHLAHQPRHTPAGAAPAPTAQLGVDPWRAADAAPGGEHAADVAAQPGLRPGPGSGGGDRAQPGVGAAHAGAGGPAQGGDGVARPLGGDEGEPAHAIPRAKKAAAFPRIPASSSSRLFSRRGRCDSACPAFRRAGASADPAAERSSRRAPICPGLRPSSVATSPGPLPPSSGRLGLEPGREPAPGPLLRHPILPG